LDFSNTFKSGTRGFKKKAPKKQPLEKQIEENKKGEEPSKV
jgi:hypothetical protein